MPRLLGISAGLLAGAVLIAPHSGAAAPGDELPDGEGRKILTAACTTCHDLSEVTKLRGFYTRAQWRDVVVTMKEYGAAVDDTQIDVLADYLTQHLGKTPAGSSAQTSERPSFEVTSVKAHPPGEAAYSLSPIGDRFVATNVPLRLLVQWAYRPGTRYNNLFLDSQIIGGPNWINTDRFDIQAKAEAGTNPVPFEQLVRMTQSLLEDRFRLRTHRETREAPVYALVVAKSGVRMKLSETQVLPPRTGQLRIFDPSGRQPPGTIIDVRSPSEDTTTTFSGSAAAMPMVVNMLQRYADRPIVDETSLKGLFDFRLTFSRPVSASPGLDTTPQSPATSGSDFSGGPQLFTAIQEQLGLKLEPKKGPVEVLIIDGADHPSEN